MLEEWILPKLEQVRDQPSVLLRDPLRLLPEGLGQIDRFARENGFTVIAAAANLTFRELYEAARHENGKLLMIDRARPRGPAGSTGMHAPAPFYPDLLARTAPEARLELDLREFLRETTGDHNWPAQTKDPHFARLIVERLPEVLQAHKNLVTVHKNRFTDADFGVIVAFAALGAPDRAFSRLRGPDYLNLALRGRDRLKELDDLAPEITRPIYKAIRDADPPYCWFSEYDPEAVTRAIYLSAILAQHTPDWSQRLGNIDSTLPKPKQQDAEAVAEAARKLVEMDAAHAERDLTSAEETLDQAALEALLFEQLKIETPEGFEAVIRQEGYSTLILSAALLMKLEHRLSAPAAAPSADPAEPQRFVHRRESEPLRNLRDAIGLVDEVRALVGILESALRTSGIAKPGDLSFAWFWGLWNGKRINRLEYFLARLERLLDTGEMLPREEPDLPGALTAARDRIRKRVRKLSGDARTHIDALSRAFQSLVAAQYPDWVEHDGEPVLTAQFVRRCLKPNWDPETEPAVILIFDGMRYDIWDELLRPMLQDRMELVREYMGSSILPSETQLTRKAISAGTFPDEFKTSDAENHLLQAALDRDLGLLRTVEDAAPEGSGTGETVRYRAGNLEVYIFDLCDKELHKIQMKTLADDREVPSRPLALIYDQVIRSLLDTEVMAVVRRLKPGTKVFITADHGFGRVGREKLWFNKEVLNDPRDCAYLNCKLKPTFAQAALPPKVRDNVIAFTPAQLRFPEQETIKTASGTIQKTYGAVLFPRLGYSFSRPGSPHDPDAYSHGGISIPELMIPMVVLKVRGAESAGLRLEPIHGPEICHEGQDLEFRTRVGGLKQGEEMAIEVEASYAKDAERFSLPRQTLLAGAAGAEILIRFRPDSNDASPEERKSGLMRRTLVIGVSGRRSGRPVRSSGAISFSVELNPDRLVRRVPAALGTVLGLTPKSMR